ncbi:MarR family winged helix-turn-helix transcriptional regulator [Microbacterium saperdae]|uniref:DNA-binding MarR family transcriptional regulator n=1 Tax=Microbacterium saperdae TaxID=69368 RepID=A0A543BL47_9MICO|nr:MarR family transcriptional regulator [Microbacterium saperdae]TQL85541.1 DNA-binding MarR family transcriptional regulator [Microbacterium saperdae]GGM63020.1 hypothetical protein GCM10010489_38110 [Microbacterium saperdae]
MMLEAGVEFFDLLVGVETALWNRVEGELLAADQVGLGTWMALRVLHRHGGGRRVRDLRAGLSITVGAASKLVDRLERDGLAVRRPHPDDRRSSLIVLTDAGERARTEGERLARRTLTAVLGDTTDVAAVTAALVRLQARLVSADEGALV